MDLGNSLRLIAPEIFLGITSLGLLLAAAWLGDRVARALSTIAALALAVACVLVAPSVIGGAAGIETMAFGDQFRADAFAGFAKLLIYVASIAALIVAPAFFGRLGQMRSEYPVLILLAAIGMGIMVSATDLMTLYVGLELNSLAGYVLAAMLRGDGRSAEAGLKYFVLGALASGILLFGVSLVYGFSGSTSFEAVRLALAGEFSTGALLGLIFVFAGLAFKISAVPFHMWTPDVYEGAPTPVTTFFATAPKVASVALTARVMLDLFGGQVDAWRQIVIFAALASIIVGALGAIAQTNIKRLLAYSSINNIGFLLIGLAAGTADGAGAMLAYLTVYTAMTAGSFVVVLMMRTSDGVPVEGISDLAGLATTRPMLAWCMLALMFSLAGIPPFLGFWAKLLVFQAAVEADLIVLAVLGIIASLMGAFYYIKIVKVMFFDAPAGVIEGKSGPGHWAVLVISALVISPLGFLVTGWIGDLARLAAASLFIA